MRKGVKRLMAVFLLIGALLLVGYSCYTGSQLASPTDNLDSYKKYVFRGNGGTMVAFTDKNVWYTTGDMPMILLEINEYKEGVISMQKDETFYKFVAIDEKTIYDTQTKELLIRRGDG